MFIAQCHNAGAIQHKLYCHLECCLSYLAPLLQTNADSKLSCIVLEMSHLPYVLAILLFSCRFYMQNHASLLYVLEKHVKFKDVSDVDDSHTHRKYV